MKDTFHGAILVLFMVARALIAQERPSPIPPPIRVDQLQELKIAYSDSQQENRVMSRRIDELNAKILEQDQQIAALEKELKSIKGQP